jgi:hypothetical protein
LIYLGGGFWRWERRGEGGLDARGEGMGIGRRDDWKGRGRVLWVVVSGYGFPFRMVVLVVGLLNP